MKEGFVSESKKIKRMFLLLVFLFSGVLCSLFSETFYAEYEPMEGMDSTVVIPCYVKSTSPNFQDSYCCYTADELKNSFLETSKLLDVQKLENELTMYEYEQSEKSKKSLKNKIRDALAAISDMQIKIGQTEEALRLDDSLPAGHPQKLSPMERATMVQNKKQLEETADSYEDNLRDMRKNYVMLDFQYEMNKLNASYSDKSLEAFRKSELLTIDGKLLDLMELNINIKMKIKELWFMRATRDRQRQSAELGYVPWSTLESFETDVAVVEQELRAMQKQSDAKLEELAFLCGVDHIDQLTVERTFSDKWLVSYDPVYYRKKYQENTYEIDLMEDQFDQMHETEKDLKKKANAKTDSYIMDTKERKGRLQKDILLDNVELGALQLIGNYQNVEDERSKHLLKVSESKRILDIHREEYELGQISEQKYKQSELKYVQLYMSLELMDLQLVRLKLLLDAMAEGIVRQ